MIVKQKTLLKQKYQVTFLFCSFSKFNFVASKVGLE